MFPHEFSFNTWVKISKSWYICGIALNKDNQDIGGQFYVPGGQPSPDAVALKTAMDEFRDLIVKTIDTDKDPNNDFLKDRYMC